MCLVLFAKRKIVYIFAVHKITKHTMLNTVKNEALINPYVSVDCVVLGFDGEQIKVLLVKRIGEEAGDVYNDMKLPGNLIYNDEDLDEAAQRVLTELTGITSLNLLQFRAFGSKDRTKDSKDVRWLERAHKLKIDRIVTVAYMAMVKIDKKINKISDNYQACWVDVNGFKNLAFDHAIIINEALLFIRQYVEMNPSMLFDLLPRKFTAKELRLLYEVVFKKKCDVRNFHKRILMTEYIVPLDEYQTGVAHRAARYYRFDRKLYNKVYGVSRQLNII